MSKRIAPALQDVLAQARQQFLGGQQAAVQEHMGLWPLRHPLARPAHVRQFVAIEHRDPDRGTGGGRRRRGEQSGHARADDHDLHS